MRDCQKDQYTDKTTKTTKKAHAQAPTTKKKSKDIWHVAEANTEDANANVSEDADPKVRPLQYYAAGVDDADASSLQKPAPEYVSSYRGKVNE